MACRLRARRPNHDPRRPRHGTPGPPRRLVAGAVDGGRAAADARGAGDQRPGRLRQRHPGRRADAPPPLPAAEAYTFSAVNDRCELSGGGTGGVTPPLPPLRLRLHGPNRAFTIEGKRLVNVLYRLEESRGYDAAGELFSPGYFRVDLSPG